MKYLKSNTTKKMMTLMLTVGLLFAVIGCSQLTDKTQSTDVLATGITLQSTGDVLTIETQGGTLSFSSTITPSNATDKSVTWSVINGTGSAMITQNGDLTAITNGTVTVKVVSVGTPDLSAEIVITLSHQASDVSAPLVVAIIESNLNVDDTLVGTDASMYVSSVQWVTPEAKATYIAAILDAQLVVDDADLTEAKVDQAIATLGVATQAFNTSKQTGTKVIMHIDLGTADEFVILAKSGISTTGTTTITGNIGISPSTATYITGFGLIMDSGNAFSTSSLVTGQIYAADYGTPTPTYLVTAVADVIVAHNEGRDRTADYTELYTGDLSGKTLTTGVYMWSNDVLINTDLTLNGSSTDVFIFQIAGTLTMAANTDVTLTGGLLAENIYWVVADTVAVGVGSSFQGIILAMTNVSMDTGSSITGMIYAQTSISLDATTVTKP